jgi:hypothetical protein
VRAAGVCAQAYCCVCLEPCLGLVGPLAIYAKGKLDAPGVDREIPLLFNIQNEMQSIYFQVGAHTDPDRQGHQHTPREHRRQQQGGCG